MAKIYCCGIYLLIFCMSIFIYSQDSVQKGDNNMIDLQKARARWISQDSLVWPLLTKDFTKYTVRLYWHPQGNICINWNKVMFAYGGDSYLLAWNGTVGDGKDTPADKKLAYLSYLRGTPRLGTNHLLSKTPTLLQGDLLLALEDKDGRCIEASRIQKAGILDDLYTYDGPLGITWELVKDQPVVDPASETSPSQSTTASSATEPPATFSAIPTLYLWAPTANSVQLHLYSETNPAKELPSSPIKMRQLYKDEAWTGVWYITGLPAWKNQFYLYEVEVFSPFTGRVEHNVVTDPYSISLAYNSIRSQIVALADEDMKPKDWNCHQRPTLERFTDIAIYELHLRDFSIADPTIAPEHRGTYLAFTYPNSLGMKHLQSLAKAGITHLHLLPTFDIATIEENRSKQKVPQIPDAPSDSPLQQEATTALQDQDGYNWGYDPLHYQVPEGSYSTNPCGSTRIKEFRAMVQALHQNGLHVVLDVVFNHTHSSGQASLSILDKIVPGYYYRLNEDGAISCSTCCPDTATEHNMMERLMIDSIKLWAKEYQIDGFRFDLMGHHTTQNMRRIREMLNQLNMERDGIVGHKIYLYGEAWRFGSLDAMLPMEACHQVNTYGLGIGSFNDRIRDAIRGGSPFTHPACQGFANGLYYDFNRESSNRDVPQDAQEQKNLLLNYMDNIAIGLAGNLRDYRFTNSQGQSILGKEVTYHGNPPTGYTASPSECINYVSVHDNQTLWDYTQAKAPFQTVGREPATATVEERVRMHQLSMALIALGQGIPFFHAGDDILRSKSGDCNSYNSGDWVNKLDFTYSHNNWGIGLPAAKDNQWSWEFLRPRLSDPNLQVSKALIFATHQYFLALLGIRKSSCLFRLETLEHVQKRLEFIPAEPGIIVMQLRDDFQDEQPIDQQFQRILCIFNALPKNTTISLETLKNHNFILHPILVQVADPVLQQAAYDSASGNITVPGRSTVVYVEMRK